MTDLARPARWLLVGGLVLLTWPFVRTPIDPGVLDSFLHLPNLVFHEAGHVLFLPFGRFMSVLGGSLMQLLVPLACAATFVRQQGNRFAAAVCIWWAGQSLVDLAPYVADARALRLVLLGGRTGAEVEGHDWEYLLGSVGLLQWDVVLGRLTHLAGSLVMIGALCWAVVLMLSRRETETGAPATSSA
jgi:hypothetical protein